MREAQGALPLDPARNFLERKFLDFKELFLKISCFIFNGSVLSERNRFFVRGR